jgi:hypothetical protein
MKTQVSMTVAWFVAALLGGQTASAADFGTLDFGARCDTVTALETARGALPLEQQAPSGYLYAFRDRYLDRDVVVGYACYNGVFFRGAYIFQARDMKEASALYKRLKTRVIRDRGAPSYDFASAQYRRGMAAAGATLRETDTEVAFWTTRQTEAHLSVAEPSGGKGWRVSLSYTDLSRAPPEPRVHASRANP